MAAMAVAGFAQAASAVPSTPGLYIVDNSTATSQFVALSGGIATWSGTVGNWTTVISTGQTVSGGAVPYLDLDVTATRSGAGATSLDIYYSDIGFGPNTGGGYQLYTYLGTVTGGSATTSAYLSTANTPFATTTALGGSLDVAGVNATINASGVYTAGNPYAITILDHITGNVVSMDTTFTGVPDGGATVMLLGAALSALGLFRKKLIA